MQRTYSAAFVLVTLSANSGALFAQQSQISGRILDQSQAIVRGAVASLTREGTGDRRQTLSTAEGYYSFPVLLPGVYDLIVQKDGFDTQTRRAIKVETGQITGVDVTLALGSVAQTVDVDGALPLLQAESAAVSHVVTHETIANMPLIDRRSSQLTRLNGFVVQNGSGSGSTFAIAGGRGDNTNYYVDGGTVQNVAMGTPTLYFDPPVEAMQEFNVNLSNYAAELGRSGGGVLQMTTRSGTNQFHGSAYEYFRNDRLNANTFFATAKPVLRYNLFGGSLGGPIRKNRTQFFFNYEGRRQATASTRNLLLPTPAELRGDFSADTFVVKDPLAGQPFAGNVIPANRIDPVGGRLAGFYPAPNQAVVSGSTNYIANDPSVTTVNNYVARIDHVFSDNDRIFGRFLGQPDTTTTASIFPTAGTDPYGYLTHNYYYNGSVTWTHNLSATAINEARLTLSRRQTLSVSAGANTTLSKEIGLLGANQSFFPTVTVSGYTGLGNGTQERLQTPVEAHQISDSITKTTGTHQLKIGGEYRYGKDGDLYLPSAGGALTFNSNATGSSVASMLLGWVNQGSVLATYPLHSRVDTYAAYVQDDWRLTPKLTLNVGLRYDLDTPRRDIRNRQNSFDPAAINPVSGTPGVITFSGIGGQSQYAHNWDRNNLGPRIGFAWKAPGDWVVRGGGGILYTGEYDFAAPVILYSGFSTQGTFLASNNGATPAFILANGFPALSSPTKADLTAAYGAVKAGQSPTTAVTYFDTHRKTGYLYQASLDIQKQLRGDLVLDLGYLGTFGHHLPGTVPESVNQVPASLLGPGNTQAYRPFPQFSNVQVLGADVGYSKYNGLNIGLEKRMAKGLQFKANYTFSKFLDNIQARSELGATSGISAGTFADYYHQGANYGLSGNDIRHRFIGSAIYELPVGKGKLFHPASSLLNQWIGGWSVGAILEKRTGTPLDPFVLTNQTNSYSDGVRPNVVGDPAIAGNRTRADQLAQWFNVKAFALPAAYTFGNAGRTFGAGPGLFSLDASLLKDFAVERLAVQFRAEALNLTNHANFANPDTRLGSSTFGRITSLVSGNQARIIQLGLHLQF